MLSIAELHFTNEDGKNVQHIARHNVIPEDIEEVCAGPCIARETYGGRVKIVGQTDNGRILSVILGRMHSRIDSYYPITARDADKQERALYRASQAATDQ
jgi:uncharacterized DUF497 family protein